MAIEINIPDIGIDEVEVTEILVKIGDKVEVEQSLITVEGDKASIDIPSPHSGFVKEIIVSVGDKVKTGKLIMLFNPIEDLTFDINRKEKKLNIDKTISSISELEDRYNRSLDNIYVHATPLVRRLAREFDLNLAKVKGTGHKGRILREDVRTYIKEKIKIAESIKTSADEMSNLMPNSPIQSKSSFDYNKIEEIELSRIQKISGANLSRNWRMIPHITHFDRADITELEIFRKQQNNEAKKLKLDIKITPVVLVMKAVAFALEKMPRFNSSLSEDGERLILKKYINIGIAVDTENGLLVPVIRDVNKKGIIELSRELVSITKKARDGKLISSEMQEGCFTISSIGNLGTTYFSPIVNFPEVAILGISKSSTEPVWNGKEFAPRIMLPISLSLDHRVIDGADGARFITIVSNILSDIRCLLI